MQVDNVLILAAGKGTRMGRIGRSLPKLLWPVFEKSLVELQVAYAKTYFPSAKIFINVYNYADKIVDFIDQSDIAEKVSILTESCELDIGGAIHNLAESLDYQGNLFIINGDQFLMIDHELLYEKLKLIEENPVVLFSYQVSSSEGYNALELDKNNFLANIIPNQDIETGQIVETYTGTALINLADLSPVVGKSRFFESVACYHRKNIRVVSLSHFEYWDFGTVKRFYRSHFEVLKQKNSLFYQFLIDNKALNEDSIFRGRAYRSTSGINLDLKKSMKCCGENTIVLNGGIKFSETEQKPRIIGQGLIEFILF